MLCRYEATPLHRAGRRVYRHTRHLLHLSVWAGAWGWVVEPQLGAGGGFLHSAAAPSHCAADPRAAENGGWTYLTLEGRMEDLEGLRVVCSLHSDKQCCIVQ